MPGTDMDNWCDSVLHVPSKVTMRVQECHIMAAHILCALSEEVLLGPEK